MILGIFYIRCTVRKKVFFVMSISVSMLVMASQPSVRRSDSDKESQTDLVCSKPSSAIFSSAIFRDWNDIKDIEELEDQVADYKRKLDGEKSKNYRCESLVEEASAKLKVAGVEIQYWQNRAEELQQRLDDFNIERDRSLRSAASRRGKKVLNQEVNSLKQQLQKTKDLLENAENRAAELSRREQSIRGLKKHNQSLTAENQRLKDEVDTLEAKLKCSEEDCALIVKGSQELASAYHQDNQDKKNLQDRCDMLQQQADELLNKNGQLVAENRLLALLVMELGGGHRLRLASIS